MNRLIRSSIASPVLLSRMFAMAAAAIAVAGCGRTTSDNAPPVAAPHASDPSATSDYRVALVMSGPTSDNGWNGSAAKALAAVQAALKLGPDSVKSVDNQTSDSDREKSLRDFAARKFNLVFGHGSEYEALALKMESEFPNTLFVISSGRKVGHNTMPIVLRLEDGAYLEGMLAAGMSRTGKIGAVGAEQTPPLESVFKAFERGAKAINPHVVVVPPVYTNDWNDPGKAKRATLALLDQGADVIMQDVDAAAQGVFNAVQEFRRGGKTAYALGTNSDQNAAAPDVILASAPIYNDRAFVQIAEQAKAGSLRPNDRPFGMKEGVIGFVYNPALVAGIPVGVKKTIDDAQKRITSGALDVTSGKP